MRRLFSLLLGILLTTSVFAADGEESIGRLRRAERLDPAMIVHPAEPLTDADRADLASRGIVIRHALSDGRYLARVRAGADLQDARITSVEPLTTRMKLAPSAIHEAASGKAYADVQVIFQSDVAFDEARAAILEAGGALDDPFTLGYSPSRRLTARIPTHLLEPLAADQRVLTIAGVHNWRVKSDNAVSAQIEHVTEVLAAPYNLSGNGVAVSLFELAEGQADHVEFQGGRFTVRATGGTTSDKQHATHVAGTIGAAGVNPQAKGMAPASHVYQFCVKSPSNTCKSDWLKDKDKELSPLGIVADNNSWGYVLGWTTEDGIPVWLDSEEYYGAYELTTTAVLDQISNDRNVLFVHSAGNDGDGVSFSSEFSEHLHVDDEGDTVKGKLWCYSKNGSGTDCPSSCAGGCEAVRHQVDLPYNTIGVTASAKNVITVGAITTLNPQLDITNFSSRGPARDGRVKPDVVARGYQVLSSFPNNSYGRMNGTSQASPSVTGIAALITEQWRKMFAGANPTPAQLKALIIAGATDLGNPGPDYTFGFGLVNAKASIDALIADQGTGTRIRNFTFSQGQSFEVPVVVTGSQAQNLRFVLNWPDPAIPFLGGDDISAKALVNDLDLKVVGPAGSTFLPWVLNRDAFRDNATKGVNTVDNVEMVEIPNAPPGNYRVVVTGTKINQGPQTAVLVTSADAGAAALPCRDPQETNSTNDTPANATGGLVSGQEVRGGICSATDVDYFTFNVTKAGLVTVTITTRDTPVRATLTGNGVNKTLDVPANSTLTIDANVTTVPNAMTLRLEQAGNAGTDSSYTFTPRFGNAAGARRHSVGK
ncbi:MAG: S8 family serine peptidase [Acidobacteriota bacterium]|nr:S8 family serine peptidase [Acidobacteriota bacterium]